MKSSLKPFIVVVIVAVAVLAFTAILQPREIIPWRTDYSAARQEAARDHKPLFLYFAASWCGPCQTLKHTTWADSDVDSALRAYVPVKIDVDQRKDLAEQYQIESMPTFIVIDGDQTKKRYSGAMQPGEFLEWIKG